MPWTEVLHSSWLEDASDLIDIGFHRRFEVYGFTPPQAKESKNNGR